MSMNDYLFRWDRGCVLERTAQGRPNTVGPCAVGLFDIETSHAASRLKSDRSNEKTRVLTDVGPSLTHLKTMMDFNEEQVHVYPIWHLPFRLFPDDDHIYSCEAVVKDIKFDFQTDLFRGHRTRSFHTKKKCRSRAHKKRTSGSEGRVAVIR